jgi:hypothetical protein
MNLSANETMASVTSTGSAMAISETNERRSSSLGYSRLRIAASAPSSAEAGGDIHSSLSWAV